MTESNVNVEDRQEEEGEAMATHEGGNKDWMDGRLVAKRPEVRNSVLEKSHIVYSREEAAALGRVLKATVLRRRALSADERAAQLRRIAAMDEAEEEA